MSKKNFMSYGDAETILTEYAQGVKDVKNPQFTEAATRNNIASGESYKTIFGKIKKFFSDLKTVAFTGSYNDLDDTPDLSLKANKTDIDDVYKVMGRNGAKNLIPFPYNGGGVGTHTVNGINFIVNPDGSITISGTATADAEFALAYWLEDILEDGKDYIVSAKGINGSLSTYYLSIENINRSMVVSSTVDVTHDEVQFTASAYRINCLLKVKSGQTISSVTIYPMIRLASDTDSTYQRYAKTNRQLTEEMGGLTEEIGDLTQTGLTGDSVAEQLYTAKEQIANKVKFLPVVDKNYTCSSANFEYTGINISCPVGHTYIVRAQISYSNSKPTGILASSSSSIMDPYTTYAYNTNASFITFMLTAGQTAYIWGRWEVSRQNAVRYWIVDITN